MLIFYLSLIDTEEDRNKFELIYEKYRKLMFHVANQILNDDLLAEDAVQDAFVKVIENLDKIEDIDSHNTKSYIVILIRNHSINLYNHRKKRWYVPFENMENILFCDMIVENEDDNDLSSLGNLGSAVMQLPVIYRDTITLKYIHGFTNSEIALSLNINEATVRKRVERAKQKIQDILEKESRDAI